MEISLAKIKPAVDSLFGSLTTILTTLLPSQMGKQLPPEPMWTSKDSLVAKDPLVDQPEFLAMISPLYTQFETFMQSSGESDHQLWSEDGYQVDRFKVWLELEQKALQKIFLILLFTGGGVSPRAFTIAALQYRNSSERRNLYLHNGVLCFAWPKTKANSRLNNSTSLYSYPPQLNWLLFIYLGIIRRFTVRVMKELKWSLGEMENKLFVGTGVGKGRGSCWGTDFMNSTVENFSQNVFGSRVRVGDLRQLTQAIYSLHFYKREEMEEIMEETVNKMGNHTQNVSRRYYARNDRTMGGYELCLACSKAWHCWLGLISYDLAIGSYLGELPILQRRRNQVVANLQSNVWVKDNKTTMPVFAGIEDLLKRLLSKVCSSASASYEGLTFFPRDNLNMNYFVKLLHRYSGAEQMHHF